MPNKSLSRSSLLSFQKYSSLLSGNDPYIPLPDEAILAETTLTSSAANVTFSSLDTLAAGYKHLQIRAVMRSAGTGYQTSLNMRANGDTGSNYYTHRLVGNGSTVSAVGSQTTRFYIDPGLLEGSTEAGNFSPMIVDILDFNNPYKNTTIRGIQGVYGSERTSDRAVTFFGGLWNNSAVLTSFELYIANFAAGSHFSLIGLK